MKEKRYRLTDPFDMSHMTLVVDWDVKQHSNKHHMEMLTA